MAVTLFVLLIFSGLVVWHNRPLGKMAELERQALIEKLSLKNPKLHVFMDQLENVHGTSGFYSFGIYASSGWPTDLSRACYADPLLKRKHAKRQGLQEEENLELIRYRSQEDFLMLLESAENKSPGVVAKMDFRSHRPMEETPLEISIQLVLAFLVAILGLLAVKAVPE